MSFFLKVQVMRRKKVFKKIGLFSFFIPKKLTYLNSSRTKVVWDINTHFFISERINVISKMTLKSVIEFTHSRIELMLLKVTDVLKDHETFL
jgi:hypothetical protein